jgi:threonine aldolase
MSQRVIDLRSDTVTVPSDGMRAAMAAAPVGDDVYGEDPTINRLQEMAASITGKEAALFVTSGTMGNLLAMMTHCARGDEAICGSEAHVLHYEGGGAAHVANVQLWPVPNDAHGGMRPEDVAGAIRARVGANPHTALLMLENTHNRCSGGVLTVDEMSVLAGVAHGQGAPVHVDGARIFNASAALGVPVSALAATADSITFCFSKGLGAPVGSILCGGQEFIREARRLRRVVGGGMRQAGVLAAAAIYSLEHMVDRLAEDHANARALAAGLAELPGIDIDPASVQTNIVIFGARDVKALVRALRDAGVLCGPSGERVRMVTHYGIERGDIDDALARVRDVLARSSVAAPA